MSVADTVSTFAGIANENEFYSHHYLAEVFKGDIKALIERWQAAEDEEGGAKAPFKQLQACSARWFAQQASVNRAKSAEDRLAAHRDLHQPLLAALGYAVQPAAMRTAARHAGCRCGKYWGEPGKAPQLHHRAELQPQARKTTTCSIKQLAACHYAGIPAPHRVQGHDHGRGHLRSPVRSRPAAALRHPCRPQSMAAAGPLQVAQQPGAAF
jgi:hypothetical protein